MSNNTNVKYAEKTHSNYQATGFLHITVKILNFWPPEQIAVIILKLEQYSFTTM